MAQQLDYGTDPGAPLTQDWPAFLEEGSKVDGMIVGLSDFNPTSSFMSKNGTPFISVKLRFMVLDNGFLGFMDGYHINGKVFLPSDGEKIIVESPKSMDRMRRDFYPLGVDFAKFPAPVSEVELLQMFHGEGPWAENGSLFGKTLVSVTCGEPNSYENKKTKKMMGPYTTIKRFSSPTSETVDLMKERVEKYHLDVAAAAAAVPKAEAPDDDYPF